MLLGFQSPIYQQGKTAWVGLGWVRKNNGKAKEGY